MSSTTQNTGSQSANTSMGAVPVSPKALFNQVEHDIQICDQLIELLQQESEALKQRQTQTLEGLIPVKNSLLGALANSANQRRSWLQAQGKPTDESHWLQLLQEMGGQKLLDQWQIFNDKLSNSQHLNEVNGKMIARGQQTINRLLDILRGQFDAPKLYNQSGTTQVHKSSKGMVKA
ncbi:hypothetical protein R50073_27850 [Maricurvus nonylphenolicus]|uniref:flagella synthesis protein FlgN n=1 Tax=Maricurvus nonylphenolicus TaxID=1008307 RepID=UPI0036F21A1F